MRRALLVVLVVGIGFVASMLLATGGRPSLPLDDSFIYFQYAREAAAGNPLVYQAGDPPTTGATSLPWLALLTVGALLGFDGKAMIFFAMILGGLLLAATARQAGEAQQAIVGDLERLPVLGLPLAGALVLVSGPLAWGAWSGMEIALFAATIAWTFREWAAAGGRPTARVAGAAALLATIRPEGALLAAEVAAFWGIGALLRSVAWRAAAWGLVPLAAALVQPLVNLVATGEVRSAGFLAKTLLAVPGTSVLDALRIALLRAVSLGAALFGGLAPFADGVGLYAYDSEAAAFFVAPGALALFLVGVLPGIVREGRERLAGPALLAAAWVATVLVATCLLEEPDAHFSRYQMPILPVFLVGVAVGVGRLARALRDAAGGLARLAAGLRLGLVLFGVVSLVFFALAFGDNCQDIERMQIRLGESLRQSLEPGSVVAINDAGALKYFSGQRTLDLIGLTSPGFAGLWPQGSGALWEKLEALPARDRPTWFCYFPNWFELDAIGVLRRQGSVRLLTPSIVDAEKVLARADWSLAGSADAPRIGAASLRVVDRLDVADVDSERAHRFRFDDLQRGGHAGTFVRRAEFAGVPGDEAIDGGRTVFGEVELDLARDPGSGAVVVVRSVTGVRQRVLVAVDGGEEREVEIWAPGAGRFHEQAVATIPAGRGSSRVRLRLVPRAAGSAPLVLAHVFSVTGLGE